MVLLYSLLFFFRTRFLFSNFIAYTTQCTKMFMTLVALPDDKLVGSKHSILFFSVYQTAGRVRVVQPFSEVEIHGVGR